MMMMMAMVTANTLSTYCQVQIKAFYIKLFNYINSASPWGRTIIILILQMRKLKYTEEI